MNSIQENYLSDEKSLSHWSEQIGPESGEEGPKANEINALVLLMAIDLCREVNLESRPSNQSVPGIKEQLLPLAGINASILFSKNRLIG